MAQIESCLLTLLTVLVGYVKSDFCYTRGYLDTIYCPYDCCGQNGYQYCCAYYIYSGGTIAGIVVGSLVGLGLLIGGIVFCCCLQRRRATRGQVLQPQTNHGFTVMTSTTATNGTQMQTTQLPPGMYPPSYQITPQIPGGYTPYMPDNTAMNKLYGAPPPSYDQAARN